MVEYIILKENEYMIVSEGDAKRALSANPDLADSIYELKKVIARVDTVVTL